MPSFARAHEPETVNRQSANNAAFPLRREFCTLLLSLWADWSGMGAVLQLAS